MAVYKCKICGGKLEPEEGSRTTKCPFCGAVQTLSIVDEESINALTNLVSALVSENLISINDTDDRKLENEYKERIAEINDCFSRCVYASDIRELICFFQNNITYKDCEKMLCEAKYQFITHVGSYDDCVEALGYIDDLGDYKDAESLRGDCLKRMNVYREKQLISEGAAVEIPYGVSVKCLNKTVASYISALQKIATESSYDEYSLNIIDNNHKKVTEYLENNIYDSVANGDDIQSLVSLKDNIAKLNKCGIVLNCGRDIGALIDSRIADLSLKVKKNKSKHRRAIVVAICIICAVIVAIVVVAACIIISKEAWYSAEKFSLSVISKTNDSFNESLADGYRGAGYYYTFVFRIENNGANPSSYIAGDATIKNADGEELTSFSASFSGELANGESKDWNLQLNVKTSDSAREIWNTSLDKLEITFTLTNINFSDGTKRTYDVKKVIHAVS